MTRKQRGVREPEEHKGCKIKKCRICHPGKNNNSIKDNFLVWIKKYTTKK